MQLTDKTFQWTLDSESDCMVMFTGSWCPVCKQIEPYIKKLQNMLHASLYVLNIDRNKQVSTRYHIYGTPTFIRFHKGVEQERYTGAVTQDVIRGMAEVCR